MPVPDLYVRLGLALAIGLLIGLERGWQDRHEEDGHRAAGLRTFALIGLMGGVFGALSLGGDRILLASGFAVLGGALAAFMWREGVHEHDFSATSFVAALLTFMLGAFSVLGDMRAASGAAVVATILLAHKNALHGWLHRLSWGELRAGLLLAAMTFVALPLLPDRTVDPWDALNPHALWLMTILIAAVSFAGYAAVKVVGAERGLLLAAALGGLFASTAVTLTLARLSRQNNAHVNLLAGGVLAAGTVMLLRVLGVTALFNAALAQSLAVPLLAAAAAMGLAALVLILRNGRDGESGAGRFALANPFDLSEVLKFGALLTAVSVAVVLARRWWGDAGLLGLAAVSGLADVDAITLSVARLGEISRAAVEAILITVAVNTLAKCVYTFASGGRAIGTRVLAGSAAAIAAGLAALPFA